MVHKKKKKCRFYKMVYTLVVNNKYYFVCTIDNMKQ